MAFRRNRSSRQLYVQDSTAVVLLCAAAVAVLAEEISFLHVDTKEEDSSEHGALPGRVNTSCPCGQANRMVSRVVGGRDAQANMFPWVGALKDKYTPFMFCGATLVGRRHAVTGAHCTWRRRTEGDPIVLVLGEHQPSKESGRRLVVDIARIVEHERFNRLSLANDIALLFLAESVQFSPYVQPVCLPTAAVKLDNKYVKILGWGNTTPDGNSAGTLQQINMRVVPTKPCSYSYPGRVDAATDNHLCTYRRRRGSCQGDSGGPVVWRDPDTNRYTLVGIVSFGNKCASTTPTVNTHLPAYLSWLTKQISVTDPDAVICQKI